MTSTPFTDPLDSSSNGLLDIGNGFNGQIDEVRVYPRTLSAAQIFQRYIETKDGLTDTNTIVYQETNVGDTFEVQVIPIDSWEDGDASSFASLNVVSAVGNGDPSIDWYSPADLTFSMNEGTRMQFMHLSSDPDG